MRQLVRTCRRLSHAAAPPQPAAKAPVGSLSAPAPAPAPTPAPVPALPLAAPAPPAPMPAAEKIFTLGAPLMARWH